MEDEDTEAELVAEAIAAVQANMDRDRLDKQPKRSASVGALPSSCVSHVAQSNQIFMIRVMNSTFSFYKVNFASRVIEIVKDYNILQEDEEIPPTTVYKLKVQPKDNATGEVTSSSSAPSAVTSDLQFVLRSHRECIITCLDYMRSAMLEE